MLIILWKAIFNVDFSVYVWYGMLHNQMTGMLIYGSRSIKWLLVLASTAILVFRSRHDLWPRFIFFLKHVIVYKWGLLFDEERVWSFCVGALLLLHHWHSFSEQITVGLRQHGHSLLRNARVISHVTVFISVGTTNWRSCFWKHDCACVLNTRQYLCYLLYVDIIVSLFNRSIMEVHDINHPDLLDSTIDLYLWCMHT